MQLTRRHLLTTAAAAGATTFLPWKLHAGGHLPNEFKTSSGLYTVNPIGHASFVMDTPSARIYVDPVGEPAQYADFPEPDLILITHEHGDHFAPDLLTALTQTADPHIIANPAVAGMMPEGIEAESIANGESTDFRGTTIEAIPAYNITEDRLNFHPKGRDNGYVLNLPGLRTYISGDTEDTPEMRALENIDLAFVCMNLPFTMGAEAAASAVNEFKPTYCYPYHYRGRDNGTQDPEEFAAMLDGVEAKFGAWYGEA